MLNQFHSNELRAAFERSVHRMRGKKIERLVCLSVAPAAFLRIVIESFRSAFPGILIDILALKNRSLPLEVTALFDRMITVERMDAQTAQELLKDHGLSCYDVALVITEKSSIGFDDPTVYKAAKVLGQRVLMVDYNIKFYSRFLSRWGRVLRRYRRNWVFYRQEPLLLFSDTIRLVQIAIHYLILKKRPETPDMVKAKKMRDRALAAQKESAATQDGRPLTRWQS
jgi:hypothetical protein